MSEPTVSVVLPYRDEGALLRQTLRSLRAQTHRRWEALLVNDGASREAVAIAREQCREDGRFRLLQVDCRDHFPGPWLARNVGIEAARAPLIAFLDADDLWHPEKLSRQLPWHRSHPGGLSVSAYHRFRAGSLELVETRVPPALIRRDQLLRGNGIPLSSVVADRRLVRQGFEPERHEDYGLWLRLFITQDPPPYHCLREPLMAYRIRHGSLSARRSRSVLAVEKLFRRHLPSAPRRLARVGLWTLSRLQEGGRCWLESRRRTPRLLPDPYRAFLGDAAPARGG